MNAFSIYLKYKAMWKNVGGLLLSVAVFISLNGDK